MFLLNHLQEDVLPGSYPRRHILQISTLQMAVLMVFNQGEKFSFDVGTHLLARTAYMRHAVVYDNMHHLHIPLLKTHLPLLHI